MKLYLRVLLLAIFIMGVYLIPCLAQSEDSNTNDGQSGAIEQVKRILEETLSGTIIPEVQAAKKGLAELKKDVDTAIKSKKVDTAAVEKLQHDRIIAEAETNIRLAEQYAQMSLEKAKEADVEPDPARKLVAYRDAMNKADMARKLTSRVNSVLGVQEEKKSEQTTPRAIQSLNIHSNIHALQQLIKSENLSVRGYVPANMGDYREDATGYDPSSQILTTGDGQLVDVRYLKGSFKSSQPGEQQPIFELVPSPVGQKRAFRLIESAQKEFSSSDKQVGGVDLEVTLDLLSFLKVSGFSKRGSNVVVKSPILVSLRELYKKVLAYSNSSNSWKNLPDDLRYPGEVERVYGFVLDPQNKDIFLVCAPARSQETQLDIDTLIVGFRSAWLGQQTPAVSLDPLPEDLGGPQYVRVLNVPRDSLFAKIMLDADYAMKGILQGGIKVEAGGFQTLVQLLISKKETSLKSRFWFFPVPLGAGDIRVSESARSVIFASGVHLMAAQQQVVEGKFVDSGKQDAAAVEEAGLFTKCYEQFERSQEIQPYGIYVRLHGLIDIVTICKLLRYMGIDYTILRDFSNLPYTQYEVPHYYRGLTAFIGSEYIDGREWNNYIAGGVHIRPRAGDYSVEWYHDSTTDSLESTVDNFHREMNYFIPFQGQLILPQSGSGSEGDVESLMAAGRAAFALRQYQAARDYFFKATEKDPFYSEAFAQLGITYSLLDQSQEARAAIAKAMAIEPGDKNLEAIALDIELRSNPGLDLNSWDESVKQILSVTYAEEAASDVSQGRTDDARKEADTALRLWETNADAYFVRALTYPHASTPEASRDLLWAIKQYKKLISEANDPEIKARLARALGVHALGRLTRIRKTFVGGIAETNADWVLEELSQIANEAHDAGLIDDKEPGCLVVEALARATKVEILQFAGQGGNIAGVRELVDLAVKRFPDVSNAHWARAFVLIISGEYKEALAETGKAIELNPTQGSYFLLRANLYLRQNLYAEAKADLERAKKLGTEIDPDFEKKISEHR